MISAQRKGMRIIRVERRREIKISRLSRADKQLKVLPELPSVSPSSGVLHPITTEVVKHIQRRKRVETLMPNIFFVINGLLSDQKKGIRL